MSRRHDLPFSAKIPADVDRPDKIVYGLTARQLAILAGTGVAVIGLFMAVGGRLPLPVVVAFVLPVVAAGVVLAVARRDGMSLDRLALAALAHIRLPKARVNVQEPITAPPAWCRARGRLPAPLQLPVRAVREDGVMELAEGATAVIVRAGTLPFGLRTAGEQAALVAVFGRWLNSLDAPAQILIQARPVDLSGLAASITETAADLPVPPLEQAAREHAAFLDQLGAAHDLLVRQVLIVISDSTGQHSNPRPWGQGRKRHAARDAGAAVVLRRAEETVRSLQALGVAAEVLDAATCTAVLADSLSPTEPPPVDNAGPDEVITAKEPL
ncbi:PrgI family protein [Actinomadura sp. SCN-SB]|uniref:PrgI family protein n=1 Tax=Actinomadura sp. SCN-SB TaxID=3373092 RepID=UPI003752FF59